jgi:mRNA interferase MazF
MGNYELGEIYYIDKAYEDDPNQSKLRPAIIVDIDEENGKLYTLVATTSKGRKDPPKYYDQFKYPIYNWRKAGLTEPSWCLCYTPLELPKEALLDYVGTMDNADYDRLLDFLDSL